MFHGDYELVLRDGQRLGLSRRYKRRYPLRFASGLKGLPRRGATLMAPGARRRRG